MMNYIRRVAATLVASSLLADQDTVAVLGEETSLLDSATFDILASDRLKYGVGQSVISKSFQSYIEVLPGLSQFTITFGNLPRKIRTVFVDVVSAFDGYDYITDKFSFSEVNLIALDSSVISFSGHKADGGFFEVGVGDRIESLGLQVEKVSGGNKCMTVHEVRAYELPNLLNKPGVSITHNPFESTIQSTLPNLASNLIENLDARSNNGYAPKLTRTAVETMDATFQSCFTTISSDNAADGYLFIMTFKLEEPSFVHGVLVVTKKPTDFFTEEIMIVAEQNIIPAVTILMDFSIHIGNDPDWQNNPSCADQPLLSSTSPDFDSNGVFRYGHEEFCNMEGQYVTLVSQLSNSTTEVSVCSVGIMGTIYKRDQILPETLTYDVSTDDPEQFFEIEHIYSVDLDDDQLIPTMRQMAGSELSFVNLINLSFDKVSIGIDIAQAPLGHWILILESINLMTELEGLVEPAVLRTDIINIEIVQTELIEEAEPECDTESDESECTEQRYRERIVDVTAGIPKSWSLEDLIDTDFEYSEIDVKFSPYLQLTLKLDSADGMTVIYNGVHKVKAGDYTLSVVQTNSDGDKMSYVQIVRFHDNQAQEVDDQRLSQETPVLSDRITEEDSLMDTTSPVVDKQVMLEEPAVPDEANIEGIFEFESLQDLLESDTTGLDYILAKAARQRDWIWQRQAEESEIKVPEIRFKEVTNRWEFTLRFSEPIEFSDDLITQINAKNETTPTIEVAVVSQESDIDRDLSTDPSLKYGLADWTVTKLTEDSMTVTLDFIEPLSISQGDQPDLLLVQVMLQRFELKDTAVTAAARQRRLGDWTFTEKEEFEPKKQSYPKSNLKVAELATQIASLKEAHQVRQAGESGSNGILGGMSFNLLINLIFLGSLNFLWSSINSQQVSTHLPLLDLKFPANMIFLNSFVIKVITLEVFPAEYILNSIFFFPEEDPFTPNFGQSGYESRLALLNLGTMIFLITLHLAIGVIFVLLWMCRRFSFVQKLRVKLKQYLLWNGSLRLLVQTCFEIALLSMLNVSYDSHSGDENSFISHALSKGLATTFLIIIGTAPIVIGIFFRLRMAIWNTLTFQMFYGALIEAVDTKRQSHQWVVLGVPLIFFVRRIALSIVLIYMRGNLWGQLTSCIAIMLLSLLYTLAFKPIRPLQLQRVEIFNEVSSLILLYMAFWFTDYIPSGRNRHDYGYGYILVMLFGLLCSIVLLLRDSLQQCKRKTCQAYRKKSQTPASNQNRVDKAPHGEEQDNGNSNNGQQEVKSNQLVLVDDLTGLDIIVEVDEDGSSRLGGKIVSEYQSQTKLDRERAKFRQYCEEMNEMQDVEIQYDSESQSSNQILPAAAAQSSNEAQIVDSPHIIRDSSPQIIRDSPHFLDVTKPSQVVVNETLPDNFEDCTKPQITDLPSLTVFEDCTKTVSDDDDKESAADYDRLDGGDTFPEVKPDFSSDRRDEEQKSLAIAEPTPINSESD